MDGIQDVGAGNWAFKRIFFLCDDDDETTMRTLVEGLFNGGVLAFSSCYFTGFSQK